MPFQYTLPTLWEKRARIIPALWRRRHVPFAFAIGTMLGAVAQFSPRLFLEPLNKRKKVRVSVAVPFVLNGKRIVVQTANALHMNRMTELVNGQKEPATQAWVRSVIKPGDVFFDIGANVGIFSLLAATVCPAATIVAFEPEPATAAVLLETISLNRLPIRLIVQALGARNEYVKFNYNTIVAAAYAEHQLDSCVDTRGRVFSPAGSITMPVTTLDALLARDIVPQPTHIKIDVDGYDLEVLRGSEKTLRNVRSVAVECIRDNSEAAIDEFMSSAGFVRSDKFLSTNMAFFVRV